jgi:hypothetical protein
MSPWGIGIQESMGLFIKKHVRLAKEKTGVNV